MIVKNAGRKYAATGLPPLHVSIHFSGEHHALYKAHIEPLAQAIASLVANNVPPPGSAFSEQYNWDNRAYFPEEIDTISAYHLVSCPADT